MNRPLTIEERQTMATAFVKAHAEEVNALDVGSSIEFFHRGASKNATPTILIRKTLHGPLVYLPEYLPLDAADDPSLGER